MEETFADVICEMRDHEAKGIKEAYYGRDEWRRLIDRLERAHGDEIARTRERVRLAPELYECLRELVELHEQCDLGCDNCKFDETNCEEIEREILKRAKAALGKASEEEANND